MSTPLLSRRGIHYLATRYGWPSLRAAAFSAKYRAGHWRNGEDLALSDLVTKYAGTSGDILLMGCGGAALADSVDFKSLVGVDLSIDAVGVANGRRVPGTKFSVGDMEAHTPDGAKDAIIFDDSIYYVPAKRIVGLLERLRRHLKPGGVFIASIAHPGQWTDLLEIIAGNSASIEKQITASGRITLVFR